MCHDHRTIKHFVGSSQKVHKKHTVKRKDANELPEIGEESNVKVPGSRYPPALS